MREENEVVLGRTEDGTVAIAEVVKGIIQNINTYWLIEYAQSADGNAYLDATGNTEKEVIVKGKSFKEGEKLPKFTVAKKLKETIEGAYESHGISCDACGMFHADDQYGDRPSFVSANDSYYCRECVEFEDVVKTMQEPGQLFSAPDVVGMPVSKDFIEVETLFCDSSGWGNAGERALTKSQAEEAAARILKANKGKTLYIGLTGIGQFQVYVTIWTAKNKKAKSKKAA